MVIHELEGTVNCHVAALKEISTQIKNIFAFREDIQEKFLLAFPGEGSVHYSHLCAVFVCNIFSRWCVDGSYYLKMTFTSAVLAEKYVGIKTWTCHLQEFFSYLCQTCEIKHQWIYNITQLQMWENKSNCKRETHLCNKGIQTWKVKYLLLSLSVIEHYSKSGFIPETRNSTSFVFHMEAQQPSWKYKGCIPWLAM